MEKENTIEQVEAILGKLPEIEAGDKWKYMGMAIPETSDFYFFACRWLEWVEGVSLAKYPTMRKVKVSSPTTVTDLFGKNWQKRLWIYHGETVMSAEIEIEEGIIEIQFMSIAELIQKGFRWAHRGDLAFDEANEFVL